MVSIKNHASPAPLLKKPGFDDRRVGSSDTHLHRIVSVDKIGPVANAASREVKRLAFLLPKKLEASLVHALALTKRNDPQASDAWGAVVARFKDRCFTSLGHVCAWWRFEGMTVLQALFVARDFASLRKLAVALPSGRYSSKISVTRRDFRGNVYTALRRNDVSGWWEGLWCGAIGVTFGSHGPFYEGEYKCAHAGGSGRYVVPHTS